VKFPVALSGGQATPNLLAAGRSDCCRRARLRDHLPGNVSTSWLPSDPTLARLDVSELGLLVIGDDIGIRHVGTTDISGCPA